MEADQGKQGYLPFGKGLYLAWAVSVSQWTSIPLQGIWNALLEFLPMSHWNI